MSTSGLTYLPVALRTTRRQFDRWRRQHRPHALLPEELWQKAPGLVRLGVAEQAATIQVTPRMWILVAVEPADFLRHPGAPLDNNVCEQAPKKAILHRKNAYFYKTKNGAHVGNLSMSLIYTCELNDINPFEYLTELNKHASELSAHLGDWMPWNYRDALAQQAAPQNI